MFLATKPAAKTATEALLNVLFTDLAVSFHAIAVSSNPCPWNVM
jgi:hypothetical protein